MLSFSILLQMYYAFIHSHLSYSIVVWGGANASVINDLYLLQKKAVRIICKKTFRMHATPLFHFSKILKLEDLYKLNCLKLMFRINNNGISNKIQEFFFH